MPQPETAIRLRTEVTAKGTIEVPVPFPSGTEVIVYVAEEASREAEDLISAAQSSLDFWNNPLDDEDWNRA